MCLFKLSWPHPLCFPALEYSVDAFLHRDRCRGDLDTLCYCVLFYSLLLNMETLVYKSSLHVWEKFIGIGSAQALFSPDSLPKGSFSHFLHLFLSISQNVGDRKSRSLASSLWAFTSIFHMHYETQLIKLHKFLP